MGIRTDQKQLSAHELLNQRLFDRLKLRQTTETKDTGPLKYPEHLSSTEEQIIYNAKTIGLSYELQSGVEGLQHGFAQTFIDVSQSFARELALAQEENDPEAIALFTNALAELELLSAVERVASDADFDHMDERDFMEYGSNQEPIYSTDISGINATMIAGSEEQSVHVTKATWNFDRNGIRLSVDYINDVTGEALSSQISMDFHRRKHPRFGNKEQAAIDLKGRTLERAFRDIEKVPQELGEKEKLQYKDYHRYLHIDPLIKDDDTFKRIREARILHFRKAGLDALHIASARKNLAEQP